METARIMILVDNYVSPKAPRKIMAEHGLSIWIETPDGAVLFDTGSSGTALKNNADLLGVDLSRCSAICLSHGHYDHVGGLEAALALTGACPIHMHPLAARAKYSGTTGRMRHADSEYFVSGAFRSVAGEICESVAPREVIKGIWTTGEIPRRNDLEDVGGRFYLDPELTVPDTLPDDQALFLPTTKGTIVVLGCAHAGIIYTLVRVRVLTDNAPICAVIGGTHLDGASGTRMAWTLAELKRLGVREIHPCHCTGIEKAVALCNSVGGDSSPAYASFRMSY